jgi:hypothetical protein
MPKKLCVFAIVASFSVLAVASRPASIVGTWQGVAN